MTCPNCQRATIDGLLCIACTATLKASLRELPELLRELDVNITRQSRYGSGNRGGHGARKETPLLFAFAASDQHWAIRNTLLTWMRELDLGDLPSVDDPANWCHWLLARVERIRAHADAAQIVDEIGYCRDEARRLIDRPTSSRYCGQCATCGQDLLAPPGEAETTCRRCDDAGIGHSVNVEQAWQAMQADLLDKLLPRRDALIAAGMHGAYVKDGTLRYWISKGFLRETGGRIHVGELVSLAKKMHSKTA